MEDHYGKDGKRKFKGKGKGYVSLMLLLMVFALWGLYGILQSDFFNLKTVVVKDHQKVMEEEILEASKLIFDRSILKIDLEEVEENITFLPYIRQAKVERKLPSKLIIQVKEREDYAIISYMGKFIYIDKEGVILKSVDSYIFNELPLINGTKITSYKLGEKVLAENFDTLMDSLVLIEASKLTDMTESISEIDILNKGLLRLSTVDGNEVLLAEGNNHVYSMLALKDIMAALYSMNRTNVIIDLRFEGHVTVKDREGQEE
ncbi:cell division protein FtsQ/DivIB [Alkaliphilus serpentinus]|uniref:FtsQ-type POTRA domain-containing protein n=1 Tax=Alkaliphilus serpentinus TaxID=1482731 RepID=A0A833M9D7_9FIRM|nr:FtsQ-type POTRA domain-containing protein [Alkaliphilus serpentinus]KAB3533185.1 FtsQ-type POTRA domain-containing protein [Alkaliphilus serpentinus]